MQFLLLFLIFLSESKKNESEPGDGDAYLYAVIIPSTYGSEIS